MRKVRGFSIWTLLLLPLLVLSLAQTSTSAENVDLYVSPSGNDASNGDSPQNAVKSLSRIKELVPKALAESPKSISILFESGLYKGESVVWDIDPKGASITFSGRGSGGEVPVFDGGGATSTFFTVQMGVTATDSFAVNLTFENLKITKYCEGINVAGKPGGTRLKGVALKGIEFASIGRSYLTPEVGESATCAAAVRLQNVDGATLQGVNFRKIENPPLAPGDKTAYGPAALHSVYLAHGTSGVSILDSSFSSFSGSPIRIRNRCKDITIGNSVFDNTGEPPQSSNPGYRISAVSQWNCRYSNKACGDRKRDECPSTGIVISGVKLAGQVKAYGVDSGAGTDYMCSDGALMAEVIKAGDGFGVTVLP